MVTLFHPVQGNTNWFTPVDTNWTLLEQALTFGAGRIPFSDGTTLVSNSALFWDNTNSRLGVNTTTPRRRADILDGAGNPQLRLTYTDNTVYTDFRTNSDGSLTLLPTGSQVVLQAASAVLALTGTATNQTLQLNFLDNQSATLKGYMAYGGANAAGFRSLAITNVAADYLLLLTTNATPIEFFTNNTDRFRIDSNGNFLSDATFATTMTSGFFNIPGAAGAPTGVPSSTTGFPLYWDSTNLQLYVRTGGAWKKSAVFT